MTPERQALKTSFISTSGLLRTLFSPPYRPITASSPFKPGQSLRFQTIQTNWTLFFRPAPVSPPPSATLSPPRAFG